MRRAAVAIAAAALVSVGYCQLLEFCRLKQVKIEPLTNAIRVRLVADGVIHMAWNPLEFWQQDEKTKQWHKIKRKQFRLLLQNVRGIPSSLVNVGIYPVSHLEFSVPPGARESLGVICTIVLYEPGVIGRWSTEARDSNRGRWRRRFYKPGQITVDVEPSHDGRQVYIFVTKNRPPEERLKRTGKITASPALHVFAGAGGFHVSAVNVDIHRLIQRLSILARVPIYVDDQVQRRASVELDSMAVGEVLRAIADAYGLSLVYRDGAYYLSGGVPETTAAYWTSSVGHVPLKYISAQSALRSLPDMLRNYVRPDPESSSLVVVGPKELIEKVRRDVARLDQPVWHTRMRAWIVECSLTDEVQRAVSAELGGGNTRWQLDSDGALIVDIDDRRPHEILAHLTALASRGAVRIHSSPSIAVANGIWAELFAGQRQYYWALITRYHGYQEIGVTYTEAGVRLAFRPFASSKAIRVRFIFRDDSFLRGGTSPVALQRSVISTLLVPSGGTVVVGGIRQHTLDHRREWSSIYGSIPPLGPMISGRRTQTLKRQLWVLAHLEARRGQVPFVPPADEGGI